MLTLRRLAGRHAAGDAALAVAAFQAWTSGRLVPQLAAQFSTAAEEAGQGMQNGVALLPVHVGWWRRRLSQPG